MSMPNRAAVAASSAGSTGGGAPSLARSPAYFRQLRVKTVATCCALVAPASAALAGAAGAAARSSVAASARAGCIVARDYSFCSGVVGDEW